MYVTSLALPFEISSSRGSLLFPTLLARDLLFPGTTQTRLILFWSLSFDGLAPETFPHI
jgi:hypothetical protein